ncbi:MAG: ABC-2 family transporter protein [Polyangiaceae bacterium]
MEAAARRDPGGIGSYLRLLGVQMRTSTSAAAAYRFQFVLDGLLAILGVAGRVTPLYVALHDRPPIGGWTFDRALVVVGVFTMLKGVLDGAVNPSLVAVVDHIRNGTLDFLLIKPKDAQFLVCTSKFELWRGFDVATGIGIIAWAFARMGAAPSAAGVALAFLLLVSATVLLYSVWLLVVTAAFWVVRLDNLAYMFNALFDFARWPRSVMKGALSVVFTVVLPIAVMTSFPAEALLGVLSPRAVGFAFGLSASFAIAARLLFKRALGHYTSASS